MFGQETGREPSAGLPCTSSSGSWLWSQSWRDLLFCHWQVPAPLLQRYLPAGLRADLYSGRAWISAVAFRITGVRRRWLPAFPPVSSFLELNLRTYVVHHDEPAIYFLSIHAGKRSVVRLARWFTPLPYRFANVAYARGPETFRFRSSCPTHLGDVVFDADFAPVSAAPEAPSGSIDAWLLERYCLYAAEQHGSLFRTVVQHRPWQYGEPVVKMTANSLGKPFGFDLSRSPDVTHFSAGLQAHVWPFAVQDP
jgi:uncharacterized protein YqjF (DUF2071 family)